MSNRIIGRIIRIIVAFIGGVLFAYLCSWEAIFCGAYLMRFLHSGWSIETAQTSDFIDRGKLGDVYVQFLWLGVLLAAAVSFALFTLEPVGKRKLSVVFFAVLLIALLPISVANYYTIQTWSERARQGMFDVLLVLLGLVAIQRLLAYQVSSVLGGITRGLDIFLLAVSTVLIPGIFAVIWFLNAGEIAKAAAQTDGFQPSWISAIAGVVALAFAVLTYRFNRSPRH